MADETIEIDYNLNTGNSEKILLQMLKIMEGQTETAKETKEALDEQTEALKDQKKGWESISTGVKGFGLALKAAGIGLLVKIFSELAEKLIENQKFADGLNKVFTTVNTVIGELIEALTPLVDIFSNVGSAIKALVTGDFDSLEKIGSDLVDSFVQLKDNAVNFTETIVDTTIAANEYADAIVKLTNEQKLAEAQANQMLFVFQKEAEELRQIRDDVTATMEVRMEANENLGNLLQKQYETERALRQKKLDLAELELASNKDNVDLQVAVINAKTELIDLEERITGQRSEQLANRNALELEQKEKEVAAAEAEMDAANAMFEMFQAQSDRKVQSKEDEAKALADLDKKILESQEEAAATAVEIAEAEARAKEAALSGVSSALVGLTNLAADGSQTQKGIALANVAFDTATAIGGALSNSQSPTPDNVASGGLAGIAKAITITASILGNIARAKRIIQSAPTPKKMDGSSVSSSGGSLNLGGGSGSGGGFTPLTPTVSIPSFSNRSSAGGGINKEIEPLRAFVLQNDISDAAELNSALQVRSTL